MTGKLSSFRNIIYSFAVILGFNVLLAAGNQWTGAAGDDWQDPLNWSLQSVPASSDNVLVKGGSGSGSWPVIYEKLEVNPYGVWIGYSNSIGIPKLTIDYQGGIDVTNISVGYVADGRFDVEGGDIKITSGGLNLGSGNSDWGYSHGLMNIYAGQVETTHLRFGVYTSDIYQGGSGYLNIEGGSLKVYNIVGMGTPHSGINLGLAGMLVITGNFTVADAESWVSAGSLTACGGNANIRIDDIGVLVITATQRPDPARALYRDAAVNIADLERLSSNWLSDKCGIDGCGGADINYDDNADNSDLARLAAIWNKDYYGLFVDSDGGLLRNGTAFSHVGVNYFDCFYALIKNPSNNMYIQGFSGLKDHNIKLARIMGCGFWPVDMQLYFDDKAEYFRRFDLIVERARINNVGLIPSLFWTHYTIADIIGEPVNSVGNPKSETISAVKQYIQDVVSRYADSPAIYGWEVGNEWSNAIDLPNAETMRPPTYTALGNPAERTEKDELTLEMLRTFMFTVASEIRKYDPYRMISSGNSYPRSSAWHQWYENSWTGDNDAQKMAALRLHNPDPVDCISVHYYESERDLVLAKAAADSVNKTIFVGEFGANGYTQQVEDEFDQLFANVLGSNSPISAVWVYNKENQDDYNLVADPYDLRYYQLQSIFNANRN